MVEPPTPPIAFSQWAFSLGSVMTNRREFIQTTAVFAGSFILPNNNFASAHDPKFHFIHTDTLNSWPVADLVQWSLEHSHEPILPRRC